MSHAAAIAAWNEACAVDALVARKPSPGDVVEHVDGTRGVVVVGLPFPFPAPSLLHSTDFVVRIGPGHDRVSNNVDNWRVVPPDEQTAAERIAAVDASWQGPGEGGDSYEWHLLAALLPPGQLDYLTSGAGDWPEPLDLALAVARLLDKRRRVRR